MVLSEIDVDEFGDEVSHTFEWRLDGEPFEDHLEDSVAVGHTKKGQDWEVIVTPVDGRKSASDAIRIANSVPTVSIYLAESSPSDADLEAFLYEDDADEDPLTYSIRWTVDGEDAGLGDTVVPASETSSGETWTIHVIPDDGEDIGDEVSASVSVD